MTCQQLRRVREERAQRTKKDREKDRQEKYLQTDPNVSATIEDSLLNMVFGVCE